MPSLRDVKRRITSIRNTSKVTHALEAVSATKMRRWQERALLARPYAVKAIELLAQLKMHLPKEHPIFKEAKNEEAPAVIVVVSADKGLCGGHNVRLLTKIQNSKFKIQNSKFIALGRYGRDYLKRRGKEIILEEVGFGEKVSRERIKEVYEFLEQGFLRGMFSKVLVAYTEFHTTLKQEPKIRQLLPVHEEDLQAIVESIIPRSGKYAVNNLQPTTYNLQPNFEYTFEPSVKEILPSLVQELTQVALYHMIIESNASEYSARMIAMKSATDNANDILRDLTLQYNKARQAEITEGVLEVASGAEALKRV